VIELISENCMLADLTDTLTHRIAELEAAFDAREEQHHREVGPLRNDNTALEKTIVPMGRTAAENQITNRGLEIW
jgi:tRNA U34 5-carboxymethylaminomethyl modifying GTPase MnmE/TrmE